MSLSGWGEFALAFAVFFASHSLPLRPAIKTRLVAWIGARTFTVVYSAVSLAMLVWLIRAANTAPYLELWATENWHRWAAMLAMVVAMAVLAQGMAHPNPFSFGGISSVGWHAGNPGIVGWVRHPVLCALGLWAGAHLLANGDLAHVILFGVFLGFSLLGMALIDRRRQQGMGRGVWVTDLATAQANRPPLWRLPALPFLAAALVFFVLLAAHPAVIGVSPLPF